MIRVFAFAAVLVASALSAPVDDSKTAQILRYENENNGLDGYKFEFETSDGTSRQEKGELKNLGTDNEALSVRGSYSYLGTDGVQYTVNYVADENGFQPDLPVPLPSSKSRDGPLIDSSVPYTIPISALVSLTG